jgi:hypothetical protein
MTSHDGFECSNVYLRHPLRTRAGYPIHSFHILFQAYKLLLYFIEAITILRIDIHNMDGLDDYRAKLSCCYRDVY